MKRTNRMTIDVTYRSDQHPDPALQAPLPLLDGRPVTPEDLTIAERFQAFHAANPEVYTALHRLALLEWTTGARRISVKWLFEVLRREHAATARGGERYKLNNDFTPYYADMLDADYRLTGLIERRQRKAA